MDLLLRRRMIMMANGGGGEVDYTLLPLTFKCLTGGDLSIQNNNTSWDRNFEYSLNDGAWTAFSLPKSSGVLKIATLSPGDTISFRRDNDNFYQAQFINDANLTFDIYGNLLSLQYGSAFNGQTALRNTSKQAFGYTFRGTNVVDASNLKMIAPTLSNSCCEFMFRECALLESAPELPATTLGTYSYRGMFWGCSSLVSAPSILPATTARNDCYHDMFRGCSSLITAPEISATTLATNCCYSMFYNCSSLTTAPTLLATTLAQSCYREMFYGCMSLTSAPELPATTLADSCYYNMFRDCTSINYIKCLATDTSASGCTWNWVLHVAESGTFIKNPSMTGWGTGAHGIPTGWTVIDATD